MNAPSSSSTSPQIRIIFAPLDEINRDVEPGITTLCRALSIPHEFLSERLRGVCHSFGSRTDQDGFCVWFHYLCKAVELELRHRWYKSAFFLRKDPQGNVTLVCFGATLVVRARLEICLRNGFWADIATQPLALFDLVLDGLFAGLDKTVWDLLDVIRKLERDVLAAAGSRGQKPVTTHQINFPDLHDWAKHLIDLNEGIDSSLLVVDGTLACIDKSQVGRMSSNNTSSSPVTLVQDQLRESLQYRRSLFMSTKLRLHSLDKRVSNTITLAFNVVTQQDSRLVRQDSASMTIISFMTLLFLPTAGVATIVGSELFSTDYDRELGAPRVEYTSPLFWLMWWIAIPLTVVAVLVAVLYRRFVVPSSLSSDRHGYVQREGGVSSGWGSGNAVGRNGSSPWWRKLERQPKKLRPPPGQPGVGLGEGDTHMNPSLLNSKQSSGLVSV
ncbi:hypothetical protein V8F20_011987 [Naviculisporaceae sp. PSN 640]